MDGSNKTYLGFHVKCPILLPHFNQIWNFMTDFHKSPKYQISRKFAPWESRWYMKTGGWTDGRTMRIRKCAYKLLQPAELTNKMQPCNYIYYSKIYWSLNMFRAAYRSSSGTPNCICSLWFIYPCGDRPLSRLGGKFPPSLDNGRSPHGHINQRLQIQCGVPDDERYAARNILSLQ